MSDIGSLLPPSASSIERTIETAIGERTVGINAPIAQLWNVDTCPAELLPWLAWAFSVEVWDHNWSQEIQRNVIRQSIQVHQVNGTASAARQALSAVFDEAEIFEWFQTGGDPYTFSVSVAGAIRGATSISTAMDIIKRTKPVRAHLSKIQVKSGSDITFSLGTAVAVRMTQMIDADFPSATLAQFCGTAVSQLIKQEIPSYG